MDAAQGAQMMAHMRQEERMALHPSSIWEAELEPEQPMQVLQGVGAVYPAQLPQTGDVQPQAASDVPQTACTSTQPIVNRDAAQCIQQQLVRLGAVQQLYTWENDIQVNKTAQEIQQATGYAMHNMQQGTVHVAQAVQTASTNNLQQVQATTWNMTQEAQPAVSNVMQEVYPAFVDAAQEVQQMIANTQVQSAYQGVMQLQTVQRNQLVQQIQSSAAQQSRSVQVTNHLTPNISVQFGDVRESADVDEVARRLRMTLLEEMQRCGEGVW